MQSADIPNHTIHSLKILRTTSQKSEQLAYKKIIDRYRQIQNQIFLDRTMSLNPDIRDQAYQFFVEEAKELLQILEEGLLDLKQDHSTAKVHDLMKAAHSIEAGAASVKLKAIAAIAHQLEDFIKALYSDSVKINDELERLLLQGYNCLRHPLLQQIKTGIHDEAVALSTAEPVFSALKLRLGDALKNTNSYIPNANDLGVDIVASIFRIDLLQIIEHLQEVLHHPHNYNLETELRSQLEEGLGFAEQLNLPGFDEILLTATTALDNYPDRVREIIELTIADCKAARTAILAGDRDRGGEVSPQLLALSQAPAKPTDEPSNGLDDLLKIESSNKMSSTDSSEEQLTALEALLVEDNFTEDSVSGSTADHSPIDAAIELLDDNTYRVSACNSKLARPEISKAATSLDCWEIMNKLIGELAIERNSFALQNQQMQSSLGKLTKKLLYLQSVSEKLQEVSERTLWESESHPTAKPTTNEAESELEPSEMERYSLLSSLVREILETAVELEVNVDDVANFSQQNDRHLEVQDRLLGKMRHELIWARMLPLEKVIRRFPGIVRDLSRKEGKPVKLKLTGDDVLVDKAVLEKLYNPLLYLLRHSFAWGIEAPQIRYQQGKPETGTIEIHAYYQGDRTIIDVRDDGRGLELEKIARTAIERGLLSAERAKKASQEEIYNHIFAAEFYRERENGKRSQRGIEMSLVRSQIESLKGKIVVTSIPGKGTTVSLRLPKNLTITKLLICSLGTTAFAIPSDSITELIIPEAEQIKVAEKQRFLLWHQSLIPVLALSKMLPENCSIYPTNLNSKIFKTLTSPQDSPLPLLLVRWRQKFFALEIENTFCELELPIEPIDSAIGKARAFQEIPTPSYICGCSILSDGTLIPVFDGQALIEVLVNTQNNSNKVLDRQVQPTATLDDGRSTSDRADFKQVARAKTIMIIDDSAAMRQTMALSLSKRGYQTIQCSDGKQALKKFRLQSNIDLIICDLEMPVMNGLEFLAMRRRNSQLAKIPIIMLTSRSGNEHYQLAMQLDANGYFTKPYNERDFLQEIDRVLQIGRRSQIIPPCNDEVICDNDNHTKPIASNNLTKKSVLIIDDSASLRRTMALTLEKNGYEVLEARDGCEGLEVLTNNTQIALVICDIEMPNMNGLEFLLKRRQQGELLEIPVAMLTSRQNKKHRILAEQLGANVYFSKPYIEEEFLTAIAQIIKN